MVNELHSVRSIAHSRLDSEFKLDSGSRQDKAVFSFVLLPYIVGICKM
jgi:hypothetical protein